MDTMIAVERWTPGQVRQQQNGLDAVLHACVQDEASIGFVWPFTAADARAFWERQVAPAMQAGGRALWVARVADAVAGTVQLDWDTPANQPHRAEVRKLLVHPDFRRRGIARRLMLALEDGASILGRRLLTLDTRTGDNAEPLYVSLGYQPAGVIPGFALDVRRQRYDATTLMYKWLR